MQQKPIKHKGFTLIELLVVIAIIGLLSSIVMVNLGPARAKARDGRRQSDIQQINLAMEMCYNDSNCGGGESAYIDTEAGVNPVTIGSYMFVPNTLPYQYTWTDGTEQYYCIYATLENEEDTYFCASNKGVSKKTLAGYTPDNNDCCDKDLIE